MQLVNDGINRFYLYLPMYESMAGEGEWVGNEPSARVRSKVEAHLLRPDNRKTNEAQKASLETPRCRLSGSWNLHISSGQQH